MFSCCFINKRDIVYIFYAQDGKQRCTVNTLCMGREAVSLEHAVLPVLLQYSRVSVVKLKEHRDQNRRRSSTLTSR